MVSYGSFRKDIKQTLAINDSLSINLDCALVTESSLEEVALPRWRYKLIKKLFNTIRLWPQLCMYVMLV